jgi:CRISPR system Cascade subunit CasE
MYLSRITFNPAVTNQQLAQMICHDTYKEHQALWRLFDSDHDAERDFLYRQTQEHGRVNYYVLSERTPIDHSGVWLISEPKPYAPQLVAGQTLFFSLRANPVITITNEVGKKTRHDVVMQEKKRIGFSELTKADRPLEQELVQQTCIPWLEQRAEKLGFKLHSDTVLVDGYQQHESRSKQAKSAIRYSTVDFQGLLTVTDSQLFVNEALFKGIGKAKAFGCGLMLVKRA